MTVILTNPQERTRFLRFAVVGLIGAAVDFGVMNLLSNFFRMPLVIAGTISFLAAVISNFTWNRYWTYPDSRSKPIVRQLLEFTIVNAIGLGIRVPTLAYLQPVMFRLARLILSSIATLSSLLNARLISNNLTLAIAVIIVMFWNFFVNRYWTYSDVK
jgi:putative flippase GtrA